MEIANTVIFDAMFTCHEIFAFMSASLGQELLDEIFNSDKALYRSTLSTVAEARKVRPVFLERQPRPQRQGTMLAVLGTPRFEEAAASLLRTWLLKSQSTLLSEFLDLTEIPHKAGVVEDFPAGIDDAKLKSAIESLLVKFSHQKVAVYLHTFYATSDVRWPNLAASLQEDQRLQLG